MLTIQINKVSLLIRSNLSVLEACKYAGIYIPRYCYHETLSIAGNCRMCLVEIYNSPKPMAACALPIVNNMKIYTDTPFVKKARENVSEILLLNHPLDCPICDQGGECDLQDQSVKFGSDHSRFLYNKKGVEDKYFGPIIKTIMTRCIHCTRCVRFSIEISGVNFLGTLNRGTSTEIGNYTKGVFYSEISGNVIDLCPVGALTSKPYAFKSRPWELRNCESIDLSDGIGSNIQIHYKESEILKILPKINFEINGNIISDKARFSYDFYKNKRLVYFSSNYFANNSTRKKIEWKNVNLGNFKHAINSKSNTLILLNNECDAVSMALSKYSSYLSKNILNIKTIDKNINKTNIYTSWNIDKIINLQLPAKICFFLSSNLRLESAIINAKLRAKYFNEICLFFSSLVNFNSTIPLQVLNLNLLILLSFFEAKLSIITKLFILFVHPILCFGENFFFNGILDITFLKFLKNVNPSGFVLYLRSFCNSVGIAYLNIKSINTMDFNRTNKYLGVNLNNSFFIHKRIKFFYEKKKFLCSQRFTFIWASTHIFECLTKYVSVCVPLLCEFEEEQHYFNLEQRPQKTTFFFKKIGDMCSFKFLLEQLNNTKLNVKLLAFYSFNLEIIKYTFLFSKLSVIYSKFYKCFHNWFLINKISLLPIKPIFTDFYSFGKNTKNSKLMQQFSIIFKNKNDTFERITSV